MRIEELSIPGCQILEHSIFPDERGLFREWFKYSEVSKLHSNFNVQQANFSYSKQGVVRGIHYSISPEGQAKLITCAHGQIKDVLVDLRVGSPTFLKVEYVTLKADSGATVFIASGVGHGFIVESESASVVYLTSSPYAPKFEKAISPIDPALGINWEISSGAKLILSDADKNAPSLQEVELAGNLPAF